MNVQEFLRSHHVAFDVHRHAPTFSAQHTAQVMHEPGDQVGKSVLLKADGNYVLAVLQATHGIDLVRVREALGATRVLLASERELRDVFPDCEVGAIPPFGSQYGIRTLVDEPLTHDPEILIEGNTPEESIRMHYEDFEQVERPQVAAFSRHR